MKSPDQWRDDRSLWRAFQAGERLAFACIYQRHIQQLIRYGSRICGDRQVVRDCIQDLFIELWSSRANLSEAVSIKRYLLKSLRYKITRSLRVEVSEGLESAKDEADNFDFEHELFEQETKVIQSRRLHTALASLPRRQKEAIYLRYFEEMSNEEVADVMGVNYQSACKFIYTALKKLRDVMPLFALTTVAGAIDLPF